MAEIFINGVIGIDTTFMDVVNQVNQFKDEESYEFVITSPGGFYQDGIQIMEYISKIEKPTTTIGNRLVASIATVIFMAGEKRRIEPGTEFMIHLPSGTFEGNSEDLKKRIEKLHETEGEISKIYSERGKIDQSEVLELMKKETVLTEDQLLKYGFITEAVKPAVPILNFKRLKSNKMDKNDKTFWQKLKALLNDEGIKNEVEINTTDQRVLVFPDIDEVSDIEVGVSATIEGEPADGDIQAEINDTLMVLTFEGGQLTEMNEVEDQSDGQVEELENQIEEKDREIEDLKSRLEEIDTLKNELKKKNSILNKIKTLESKYEAKPEKRKSKKEPEKKNPFLVGFDQLENLKNK